MSGFPVYSLSRCKQNILSSISSYPVHLARDPSWRKQLIMQKFQLPKFFLLEEYPWVQGYRKPFHCQTLTCLVENWWRRNPLCHTNHVPVLSSSRDIPLLVQEAQMDEYWQTRATLLAIKNRNKRVTKVKNWVDFA